MVDMNRYIVDGTVKRDKIVADIKRGKIGKSDIIELDKNHKISEAYFGEGELKKQDKSTWNNRYLDELSLVAVSESFSKDYLLYLNEVAQYVIDKRRHKERNNKIVKGLLIAALLIVFVILFIALKSKKETANLSMNSIAIAENTYLCLIKVLD